MPRKPSKERFLPTPQDFPSAPWECGRRSPCTHPYFSTELHDLIAGYNTLKYEECTRKLAIPPKKTSAESKGHRGEEEMEPHGNESWRRAGHLPLEKDILFQDLKHGILSRMACFLPSVKDSRWETP